MKNTVISHSKRWQNLYYKVLRPFIIITSLTSLSTTLNAQENFLVSYSFDLVTKYSGRLDPTPPPEHEGLLFFPFEAVAENSTWGMATDPSSSGNFSFKSWPRAEIDSLPATGSIDLTQYYEFSLCVLPSYSLNIDNISVLVERSGTGIRRCAVRSDRDGFSENLPFVYDKQDDIINALEDHSLELKDLATSGTIISTESISITGPDTLVFRFYGWSAESTMGTFCLDDVGIQGSILWDTTEQLAPDTIIAGSTYYFPAQAYDELQIRYGITTGSDSSVHYEFFQQRLSMQRAGYDAALNLYNMQDSSSLEQIELEIELKDTLGNLYNSNFDLNLYVPDSVGAASNNMALLRIFSGPQLPQDYTGPYLLGGRFSYLDRLSGESVTNLLYPMCIYPETSPQCRLNYFLPSGSESGMPWLDSSNTSGYYLPLGLIIENPGPGTAYQISLDHPSGNATAEPTQLEGWEQNKVMLPISGDSILIDSLAPGQSRSFLWWFKGSSAIVMDDFEFNSVHEDPFKHPDTPLLTVTGILPLYSLVEAYNELDDNQSDFLIDARPDSLHWPDSIILSQGLHFPVYAADSLQFDISPWDADSLLIFSLFPAQEGWNYFRAAHPGLKTQAKVLSVKRLGEELNLPARNVWLSSASENETADSMTVNYLHILDNSPSVEALTYEVLLGKYYNELIVDSLRTALCQGDSYSFGGQWISEEGIYYDTIFAESAPDTLQILRVDILASDFINLTDSICIGESYTNNGFNLAPHQEAGTYFYSDTLQNQWGCDSILQLSLAVCAPPEDPGPIYGDSLVVVAGNYTYTIKPVPNAGFYIWTVLPPYWKKSVQGHSLSLNIPYMGSGTISVKAVNCCGESASSSMQINGQSGLVEDELTSSFSLFPDPVSSGFVLETSGITGETTICVSSMAGQILHRQTKYLSAEDSRFEFSLEAYSQGMYIISIVNEQISGVEKLIRE
ncbi:MAG: T9SS type A sorting domain-containing protein [Bacteroidales bacterium]|nr:T9SS type A sorting domain-containing protein [Bacteroidales bacterium]